MSDLKFVLCLSVSILSVMVSSFAVGWWACFLTTQRGSSKKGKRHADDADQSAALGQGNSEEDH